MTYRSHTKEDVVEAWIRGENIWILSTGNELTDDVGTALSIRLLC